MSYGLHLWRQVENLTMPLDELWAAFEESRPVVGVAPLKKEEVVSALRSLFPEVQDGGHQLDWEGDGSYFQVEFTYQSEREISSVMFSCGFSLPAKTLDRIFEFARKMELSVYDGQAGKIFVPIGTASEPASFLERLQRKKWREKPA
jgi:hypothetical protein